MSYYSIYIGIVIMLLFVCFPFLICLKSELWSFTRESVYQSKKNILGGYDTWKSETSLQPPIAEVTYRDQEIKYQVLISYCFQ